MVREAVLEKARLRKEEEIVESLNPIVKEWFFSKYLLTNIRYGKGFKGDIHYDIMKFYNGLNKEKVLEIHNFVMEKRKEGLGQRKLFRLVKENFSTEIKESTISGWIFRGIKPFGNEKTWFKVKPKPKKEDLYSGYIDQKQSSEKLGEKYGVSCASVITWLKSYKIPLRNHLQSMNTSVIKEELRQKRLKRPIKEHSYLSPEKAYILGVLCGDGHINREFVSFEIRYDEEFAEEFATCFEKVYGLKYNYRYYKPKNTFNLRVSNQLICEDLLKYGKFNTREWNIPKEIMKSDNEEIIGSFLRGFYDSEGSVSRCAITSSSVNETGLKGVAILLKKLGIENTLKPQKNGKYYVLSIFRKGRFQIFKDKVSFTINRKLNKINETLNTGFFSKRSVAD